MPFWTVCSCSRAPFVLALSIAALSFAPAQGEVVEFEIPVLGNFGSGSFDIDLGIPSVEVRSISVHMSGVAEYGEFGLGSGGAAPSCDSTVLVPMDFSASVRSEGAAAASMVWEQGSSGAFSFTVPMVMSEETSGLLAHGTGTIAFADLHNIAAFVLECWTSGVEYLECSRGSTTFDRYPVVRIEYDAPVRAIAETWGTIKAAYR